MLPDARALDAGSLVGVDGRVLSDEAFLGLARDADYVLIGESHTSRCDHEVQARIIRLLADAGIDPAVGLEMVAAPRQYTLSRFNAGEIPVDELEDALEWPETWGHSFALYTPIFETVREKGVDLHALNLPGDVTRTVGREGVAGLSEEQRAFLPSVIMLPAPAQREELEGFFAGPHDKKEGEEEQPPTPEEERAKDERIGRFLLAQSLWDGAMAENAARVRRETGRPVVILAGYAHVERGWGIARRIPAFDPTARILLVCPWRGRPGEKLDSADVLFFCPPTFTSRLGMTLVERAGEVRVTSVAEDSRAAKAGMEVGDVLLRAQGEPVNEIFDLHKAGAKAHKEDAELTFVVRRDGAEVEVRVGKLETRRGGEGPTTLPEGE